MFHRRCHRSCSPPSSESFASCEGQGENNRVENDIDESAELEAEEDVEEISEDDDDEGDDEEVVLMDEAIDDDSDDADEIPIHIRPVPPKVNEKTKEECTAVLKKAASKPRYNFVQDYLSQ